MERFRRFDSEIISLKEYFRGVSTPGKLAPRE